MTIWDWLVVVAYLAGLVGFAWWIGRGQRDLHDYYLAGRRIRWWQSGLSTMATQLGAISFVSAPAFVALKPGGGLKWLCYEFGVPIGLLAVMFIIIPTLHRTKVISIYEFLEHRFDRGVRVMVSSLFQIGRGLATAVAILAGGLILSTTLGISTAQAIIIVGAVTLLYDVLGGMRVVILSDIVQMSIIVLGLGICSAMALSLVGWDTAWDVLTPDRSRILDFEHWGSGPEGTYAFWPMVLGGIFLYASYYGCDQSQVQRELTVRGVRDVRRSLLVNAYGRFPIVLLYTIMGVLVGAVLTSPELRAVMASRLGMESEQIGTVLQQDPDRMVPMFVLAFLPPGLVGLILVAIMSALMSSLDSAINSLSAATMQDVYRVYVRPDGTDRHDLIASKICTLLWGLFCIGAALVFAGVGTATRQTTIVLINAVGSLIYGPILAAFLLGILSRSVTPRSIKWAILVGLGTNIVIWQFTTVSWLWWNVTGVSVTTIVAVLASIRDVRAGSTAGPVRDWRRELEIPPNWRGITASILAYFVTMIGICYLIERLG